MIGASAALVPGRTPPIIASSSGVLSVDVTQGVGIDSRPLLTSARANGWSRASSSTASRNRRLTSLFGVMKSVARVELRMFSSAAYSRSLGIAVEQRSGASPCSTSASFQARLSASWTPELAPRAPNGETPCAASPANSTRPWRKFSMRRQAKV